jgi:hypothetical protein
MTWHRPAGQACALQRAPRLPVLFPAGEVSVFDAHYASPASPGAATTIPCACSTLTARPPQPWRIAHSWFERCSPATCQTQEPAGMLSALISKGTMVGLVTVALAALTIAAKTSAAEGNLRDGNQAPLRRWVRFSKTRAATWSCSTTSWLSSPLPISRARRPSCANSACLERVRALNVTCR